jgi:AcrR family transcriptional regulator
VSERTPSRVEEAVRVARDILEHQGPDGLTMRAIAAAMGIRAPSLYKHVEGKDELEVLLVVEALRESGQAMRDALAPLGARPPRRTALLALGAAYRAWALAHRHLYRLATEGPLPRERLPEGVEAWSAEPLLLAAGNLDRARAAWAFAHGMTILELDGRFPPGADLDAAWETGIQALAR